MEYGIWHIFILGLKDTYNYIYEYDNDRYDLNITANQFLSSMNKCGLKPFYQNHKQL